MTSGSVTWWTSNTCLLAKKTKLSVTIFSHLCLSLGSASGIPMGNVLPVSYSIKGALLGWLPPHAELMMLSVAMLCIPPCPPAGFTFTSSHSCVFVCVCMCECKKARSRGVRVWPRNELKRSNNKVLSEMADWFQINLLTTSYYIYSSILPPFD